MDKLNIERDWYEKLSGSQITQLGNGKWQTYIPIEGKVTDLGRQRITVIKRQDLYPKMERLLNMHKMGKLRVSRKELNHTVAEMILNMQIDFRGKETFGHRDKAWITRTVNQLGVVSDIVRTDEQIARKPFKEWGYSDYDAFRLAVANVKSQRGVGVSISRTKRMFGFLGQVESSARVKYNMNNEFRVCDYRSEKYIQQSGFLRVDSKARRIKLKKLMHTWTIPMMAEFFNQQCTYEEFPLWHMILYTFANTGLRNAELFGLKYSDIKRGNNSTDFIQVNGQCDRARGWVAHTKSEAGDNRPVPIGRGLYKKLTNWIEQLKNNPLIHNPDEILFPHAMGNTNFGIQTCRYYSAPTRLRLFRKFMTGKFAMPEYMAFHFFRSWIATQWKAHEIWNEYDIGVYMGHEDLNVTKGSYIALTNTILDKIDIQDFKDNELF